MDKLAVCYVIQKNLVYAGIFNLINGACQFIKEFHNKTLPVVKTARSNTLMENISILSNFNNLALTGIPDDTLSKKDFREMILPRCMLMNRSKWNIAMGPKQAVLRSSLSFGFA